MRSFLAVAILSCALAACGGSRTGDALPGDAAPDAISHGDGGDGGSVDGGPTDGGPVDGGPIDSGPSCPPTAPSGSMTSCAVAGMVCSYDACPGTGYVTATCLGDVWTVTTEACDTRSCAGGPACAPGEICVERRSGADMIGCAANPCGTGPFDCSCAASLCGGGTCSTSGFDVLCVIDCGGCP